MPVPSAISDLSQTAGSNSPAGSESPTSADDYLRTQASFIATLRDGKGFTDPVQLASGATTDIGAQNAMFVEITDTTTITSFGTTYNGPRFLRFTGALTLTHNATSLNLPTAANITTAAGDTAIAIPNQAGNGWNVVQYQRANGAPLAIADAQITAAKLDGAQSGSAPIYGARAWVNFNGTGTVAIRASGNVSSITDNGTGDYTVNLTTALPDANYAAVATAGSGTAAAQLSICSDQGKTSSTYRLLVSDTAGAGLDRANVNVVIFR